MRVAVTGGAGFIGANLVGMLSRMEDVDGVVVVDDLSTGHRHNLDGVAKLQFLRGTILDDALLDEAFSGVDAVVHLAARPSVPRSIEDPAATHEANATGTLKVLEAVRRQGAPHVIVASSSSVYGGNPQLPKHEDLAVAPMSPYAVSKLATEAYALAYAACFQLRVLALRFFNVFGPLQPAGHAYAAVVPAFVSAALSGRPLTIHGDGLQSRDFTYVGTVTAVIADAIVRGVTNAGPVNLAFGSRRTLLDVVGLLGTVLRQQLEVVHEPPRPGDVRHSQASDERLRALFPDVDPEEFEAGLRATVAWFEGTSG